MTQIPAGWYPDPAPDTLPGRQRYWDGTQWTAHVHDPQPPAPPVPPAYPPAYPPTTPATSPSASPSAPGQQPTEQPGAQPSAQPGGQPGGQPSPYPASYPASYPATYAGGQQEAYPTYPTYPATYGEVPAYGQSAGGRQRPTTPDGVPLSGWWWRVLAALLDGVIQVPLYFLAAIPAVVWQWDALSTWFSDLSDAIENDTPEPPEPALFDPGTGPGFVLIVSLVVASALYSLVFLRWKQATPGKLVVGLRVRRRETPDLPWATILARVGFIWGLSVLAQAPQVGWVFGLLTLLNYLWPLWDSKNQALHDKVARTNVVRPARPIVTAGTLPGTLPGTDTTEAGLPRRW